jgi:hypothetical protein
MGRGLGPIGSKRSIPERMNSEHLFGPSLLGTVEYVDSGPIHAPDQTSSISARECSKKFVQQGAAGILTRGASIEYGSTAEFREHRWRLCSTSFLSTDPAQTLLLL